MFDRNLRLHMIKHFSIFSFLFFNPGSWKPWEFSCNRLMADQSLIDFSLTAINLIGYMRKIPSQGFQGSGQDQVFLHFLLGIAIKRKKIMKEYAIPY